MPCGISNAAVTAGPVTPQVADSYVTNLFPFTVTITNSMGNPGATVTLYSNIIKQASFVAVSDTNISAASHFSPALVLTNNFKTVAVRFAMVATNVVTLQKGTNTLYVVDDLASSTNNALFQNSFINALSSCTAPSFRPSSVIVSRSDPVLGIGPAFASGAPRVGAAHEQLFQCYNSNLQQCHHLCQQFHLPWAMVTSIRHPWIICRRRFHPRERAKMFRMWRAGLPLMRITWICRGPGCAVRA